MNYMGSKSRIAKYIVPIIQQCIDDSHSDTYIEPFCLSKDTIVFTETGIKTIGELNIGDKILDDCGYYVDVVNKVKSSDNKGKLIKTKGNVNIKCTDNHIFYINGIETKAQDLIVGDSLDIGVSNSNNTICIDMANYITKSNGHKGSRSGKILNDNKIKLSHVSPVINRYVYTSKELMNCYGLIVSEGDKSNVTMNKNELNYLQYFVNVYSDIFGLSDSNKKYYIRRNCCQLAVPYKTMYQKLFFEAMNIGYGARNKNISFLFNLDKDLVLEAIKFMNIGDGCILNKGKYRSWNYKTSSKTLAYQLQALLSLKFGIKSTISYGVNKERCIDGRSLRQTDYYNISVTREDDISFLTGEKNKNISIHEKTTKYQIKEICEIQDEFYDITINNNSHRFVIQGGIVTHNCGGANVIDKITCKNKFGSDINEYLIALLDHVSNDGKLLSNVSKELYDDVRSAYNSGSDTFDKVVIANVGFLASYNGRWFDGGYAKPVIEETENGERYRDYYQEKKRNLEEQAISLKDIQFIVKDYRDWNPVNAVVYCDPPYENTKQFKNSMNFDFNEFWNIMRAWSKNNYVIISELNAPDDFKCIWQKDIHRSIKSTDGKMRAVEKLFIYTDGLCTVDYMLNVSNNVRDSNIVSHKSVKLRHKLF